MGLAADGGVPALGVPVGGGMHPNGRMSARRSR